VQIAAVKKDGLAIKYFKNPSEAVQLEAVKQNGLVIKHLKKPSEAVQWAAVKQLVPQFYLLKTNPRP